MGASEFIWDQSLQNKASCLVIVTDDRLIGDVLIYSHGIPTLALPKNFKPSVEMNKDQDSHKRLDRESFENRHSSTSTDESLVAFKNIVFRNEPVYKNVVIDTRSHYSYTCKRRNTTFRDSRFMDDTPLSKEDIEMEKQYLKSQYSFAPK